jgi:hypothetical protein
MDLSHFLGEQRITPNSLSFIFTRSGQIVACPDQTRLTAILPKGGETMVALPPLSELKDPVATGLFTAYRESGTPGNFIYDAADRSYIGRVVEIPARYGRDQLLGIAVPIDEIERPVAELRNQTLFYSIAFLVFALPVYATLIVAWPIAGLRPAARHSRQSRTISGSWRRRRQEEGVKALTTPPRRLRVHRPLSCRAAANDLDQEEANA